MKTINKYYIITSSALSLMINTPLLSSNIAEREPNNNSILQNAPFESQVMSAIILNSKDKISKIDALLDQKIEKLKDEIPNNISRTSFNSLGIEGNNLAKYEDWSFERHQETASEFQTHLPDYRCVWSNATKGLWVESVKRLDQKGIIVTYSYTGSVISLRNKFSFSLYTTIPSLPTTPLGNEIKSLNLQLNNLKKRIEWVSQEPTLSLNEPSFEKENIEDLSKVNKNALSLLKDSKNLFEDAMKKLRDLSARKDELERGTEKYAALAWATFQLKKIINSSMSDYIAGLDKENDQKLSELLEVSKRNIELHHKTNIKMFYSWATGGSDYDPSYKLFFEDSLRA